MLRRMASTSMITVPVRYRDELVGALTLFMGRSGRRHTPQDVSFAAELALLAAPVVVNARLVEQHRQAEEALRTSEERLRMATEAGQVGIWDWDLVRDHMTWSHRIYEMYEKEPGADTGGFEGFRSRVHPEDFPKVQEALRDTLAGGPPYTAEFRTVLPGWAHPVDEQPGPPGPRCARAGRRAWWAPAWTSPSAWNFCRPSAAPGTRPRPRAAGWSCSPRPGRCFRDRSTPTKRFTRSPRSSSRPSPTGAASTCWTKPET